MLLHTDVTALSKAWSTNATLSTTVASYVDSTVAPSTSASSALYVCGGTPPNGIGFLAWHSSSGGGSTIRVIGWKPCGQVNGADHFQPAMIAQYTVTHDATAGTTAGIMGALYPSITHVKNYGDGKSYDSVAAQKCPGWIMVDTVGFQYVGVVMTAATGTPTANLQVFVW